MSRNRSLTCLEALRRIMSPMTSLTRTMPAAIYRLAVIATGAAVLLPALASFEVPLAFGSIVFLSVLALMAERAPIELPGYGIVSGLEAAVLAALFLGQPAGALIVLAVGVVSRAVRRGKAFRWDYSVYTFFQLALCFALPFGALHAVGGQGNPVGFALAAIAASLLDQLCAAYHLFLLQNRIGHFASRIEWSRVRLTATALLPLGLLMGSCLKLGAVAAGLLFVPLAVVFNGFKTYVDTLREAREVITSLVEAAERREEGTAGHAERVAEIAGDIAREMRLKERTVRRIVTAARMHDLGKIGIEESVLNKTERLSDEDIAALRRHPEVGARVAAHLSLGKQEAEFIHFHHENFDGTGYPMGLAGQAIPQGARILAVAEAYDCMVFSERRQGRLSPGAALLELEQSQGSQFDPSVVAAFKNVLLKRRFNEGRNAA
jgi:HD-GYP domain-containing protein (c-di-GMP phosphodiesterase class II)